MFLVADGTRKHTLQTALNLGEQAHSLIGRKPTILLLNKYDLHAQWELSADTRVENYPTFYCSALTGQGVEESFYKLAGMLVK